MNRQKKKSNLVKKAYHEAAHLQASVEDLSSIAINTTLVPNWIEGSDMFWYRKQTENGIKFRLVDAAGLVNRAAFDHIALASALSEISNKKIDPENLPITKVKITLSPEKVRFFAFGEFYCYHSASHMCSLDEEGLDYCSLERLISPDGNKIAFSRDNNLWIHDLASGKDTAITKDGQSLFSYGTPPKIWGFPLTQMLQASWSPDSKHLFTVQTDNRLVQLMPLVEFIPSDGSSRPILHQYPVAFPGDKHVESQRLVVINIESGSHQEADYPLLPVNRSAWGLFTDNQAWWSSDSKYAYFVDIERGDKKVRVIEFNVNTGSTRMVFEETSSTHVRLSYSRDNCALLFPIPGSDELIWYSDRDGWAHLYLYDLKSGQLKNAVTSGDWVVRELLYFDENRREIWIQTCGRVARRDPYYLDVCRVNIDTGELISIASGDYEYTALDSRGGKNLFTYFHRNDFDWLPHTSSISPNADYIVVNRSRVDQAPSSILFNRNGEELLAIEAAGITDLPVNWQWPEPVKIIANDGITDIYGVIFRPSDFSPDRKYPVIDASICTPEFAGVPKGSFNNAEMNGLWYLEAAALAQLGFIVVMIDGRGTVYREKAFFDFGAGSMYKVNSAEDRITGIKQLAQRYAYMDLDRVGIVAFNGMPGAVYGMLNHPEFYKVGVSHALHDPRLIGFIYGELFEGIESREHDHCYAENLVTNLQGKLLLMHGLMDSMDHSVVTWRLIDALQRANKDFDMLILPNEGVGSHIGSDYAFRRTWDYFVKHLQGIEPPKEFDLSAAKANV